MSLVLFLVSKLLNLKLKMFRIIYTSFFSSILSIIILFFNPNLYDNLIIKLLFGFGLLKYGLKLKFDGEFISKMILFWIVVNLFGGITFANGGKIIPMSITLIFTIVYVLNLKKEKGKQLLLEAATCFIEFEYKDVIYKFKALVDTGHAVKTFFDEDIIFVKQNLFFEEGGESKNKRIVRYKTVSGENRSVGMKIYNINITYGEKKICNNAVIVSTPNILNQFDAIVGLSLIEGGWTNGNIGFDETKSTKIVS